MPPIRSLPARSLLAYLITHRDRPHTRDLLAGTFWPDLPDAQAHRRLSQALWQIGRVLRTLPGPLPYLRPDPETVQFNAASAYWLDAEEFEALADREDDSEAVALYRGDFLAGFYDDWMMFERERLRELYLTALARLVEARKQRGDLETALQHARRLAAEDPWREEAHCEVMRLCHLLGRDADALAQFKTLTGVLRDELGAGPADETAALAREIAQRVRGGAAPGPRPDPNWPVVLAPAILVGREEEHAALTGYLEAAAAGLGGLVLVEGEAGTGKTRLLEELARDAGWRGVQVLWGRTRQDAGATPYGAWAEALDAAVTPLRAEQWGCLMDPVWLQVLRPLLPSLAAALPGLPDPPRVEPGREAERLVNAVAALLSAWSQTVPLAVMLEDLHWAGQDTLAMLAALAPRLRAQRVLVCGSYREDEARGRPDAWRALQALDTAGLRGRLHVTPLDEAATSEFVRRSLDLRAPAPVFAARLFRDTGGNPLFVIELLRALCDDGTLFRDVRGEWSTPWDATTVDYAELTVPFEVTRVIARRLELLAPDEREALEAAAVLGDEFGFRLLHQASGAPAPALVAGVEGLVRRRLLAELPKRLRFSHDEIRRVAYGAIPAERRRALHRSAAAALEALQAGPQAALAHHWVQGEVWNRAVDALAAAGREAVALHAADTALAAFGRALAILDERQPFPPEAGARRRFELLAARGRLLHGRAGREAWAADTQAMLSLAASLADPALQAEAWLQQAEYLNQAASEYEAARAAAAAALGLAEALGLRRVRVRAWLATGTAWKQQARSAAAVDAYRAGLDALEPGDPEAVELYTGLVMAHRDQGDLAAAQEVAGQALVHAQAGDDPLTAARIHNALAWIARAQGDHRAEAGHCSAMLERMRAIGHRYYEGVALNNLSLAHSALGEYGPAIEAGERALAVFREIDHRHGQVITLLNLSSRYKATGQPAQAGRVLTDGLALARELSLPDDEARILSSLAELLTHAGRHPEAREALERAEQLARELGSDYLLGAVHQRAGELALAEGDPGRAVDRFERSLRRYEVGGSPYYRTIARSFLAEAHCRNGDLDAAGRLSRQAMAEADTQADAPPDLDLYLHHYRIMRAAGELGEAVRALRRAHDELGKRLASLDNPAWRHGFIREMPLHRAIAAEWEAVQPRRLAVRLARAGAPTGRPLRDEDLARVTWTVDAPEDLAVSSGPSRRRARLARLLREAAEQGAAPTVDDLAVALGASEPTIRRDLAALRAAGHPARTRGARSA